MFALPDGFELRNPSNPLKKSQDTRVNLANAALSSR